MKLAIIFNPTKLSGRLTKFWTGAAFYHVGWVDQDANLFYDMHMLRRRRYWSDYSANKRYMLVNCPEVTKAQLEHELNICDSRYSRLDYVLFAARPILHALGKSTPNAGGLICSEMVNIDAINAGISTPWPINSAPPSPSDWYRWALGSGRNIEFINIDLKEI